MRRFGWGMALHGVPAGTLELGADLLAAEAEAGQGEGDVERNEIPVSEDEGVSGGAGRTDSEYRPEQDTPAEQEEVSQENDRVGGDAGPDPLDADFGELEPDLIAIEGQPDDIAVEEPVAAERSGPQFIFSDDLNTIRWAKGGRLLEIAGELETTLQAGWTIERFAYLQNQIVRMDRGEAPDDQDARSEFAWITEQSCAISRVTSHLKTRSAELKAADRDAVAAFDPEAGWPE